MRYRGRPWDLLRDPAFSAAFEAIRPALPDQKWIRDLDVVAGENFLASYSGGRLIVAGGCEPHLCTKNEVWLAFDPETRACVVLVMIEKKFSWYGSLVGDARSVLEARAIDDSRL